MSPKVKKDWRRCPQSGKTQMLAFMPDDKDYPGAVVCIDCSFGVLVKKGSARAATSQTGFDGMAGIVRVHDVLGKRAEEMRYP